MTVRSSVGRRTLAGGLALAALAMAGCTAQTGAAAVVEGRAIEVADLHAATDELGPYLSDATPASVLTVLVAEPTFERVAQARGIGVSEQQARDLLAQLTSDAPGAAPEFGDAAVSVARFTLLQQALGGLPDAQEVMAEIAADLTDLDVEVNPRFGDVDFATGGIQPVTRDWLVAPTS